ncbi:MAG: SRPBCC domain-containing protein [bacterium]|nr:SRPBCC domain-containing protein [bacterium]
MDLPYSLSRTIVIRAPREIVFRYFTDSERFAAWWGEGSRIDARPGGAVEIVYPNAVVVRGEVQSVDPGRSIAFTYGYDSTQPELPAGSSLVTVTLQDDPAGTRLELRHDLPTESMRDQHVPGWRFQLAQFANVVCDEHYAAAAGTIDTWFEAWVEADGARRAELLARCTTPDVTMSDRHSCLTGHDDLGQHIAMSQMHMPGMTGERDGEPSQCQGTALVDWHVRDAEGNIKARGRNVMRLATDGRIAAVTGFWLA